jgi:hypothetical protein
VTVVRSRLETPAGRPVAGSRVTARLVAPATWLADHTGEIVGSAATVTDAAGAWSLDLTPQVEIAATGTYYEVWAGGDVVFAVVPAVGPVELANILVDPATLNPQPPAAPSLYLARAERGQPGGVASLGADGKVPAGQLPAGGGGGGVQSVTAADATIVVTGTAEAPVLEVGEIAEAQVAGLSSDLMAIGETAAAAQSAAAAAQVTAGSKANRLVVRKATVVSGTPAGDVPPDTAGGWQPYAPIPALVLPAAIGDYVEVGIAVLTSQSSSTYYDVAVKDGSGALVWFASSDSEVPTDEGDPMFNPYGGALSTTGYAAGLSVEAEHLDAGGNVQFVIAVKSNGTGKIYYSTAYPFRWRARNYGPVT